MDGSKKENRKLAGVDSRRCNLCKHVHLQASLPDQLVVFHFYNPCRDRMAAVEKGSAGRRFKEYLKSDF